MTLSADERLPENYTNNYWKADDSFPKPTGLFGKYIEKEKNLAILLTLTLRHTI